MGYLTEKEKETEGKSQSCGATGGDMAETDGADEGNLSSFPSGDFQNYTIIIISRLRGS